MNQQLSLFATPSTPVEPTAAEIGRVERDPDWPHATWRIGPGREIEYRQPMPTSPAPPPLLGGDWRWNPLVPGWRLDYPEPPVALAPRGETRDRFGPRLLPPPGFLECDRRRHAGRCPHCGSASGGRWGGPGWHGWSDPRVAAAFGAEEAAGRRCYGLTEIEVLGLGLVNPMTHFTRWDAAWMRKDRALETLHGRADFEALVDRIAEQHAAFVKFVDREAPEPLRALLG